MEVKSLEIPDVKLIKPNVFKDERGLFMESFNFEKFKELGLPTNFVQDNQSISLKNVLRGMHYQMNPFAQGKFVRVLKGAVLDVAVDLRKSSPYFGKWVSAELSEHNNLMLWIPEGFAHGFVSLEQDTIFVYKCTNFYSKESERSFRWDDPEVGIDWGIKNPILSAKDEIAPSFADCEKF